MLQRTWVALVLLVCSVARADDHPVFYVDKGACPFECCTYREWKTQKATTLHAEPKTASRVVGVVKKDTSFKAQTGEVHTKPGKLIVRHDVTTFKRGEVFWVYTYLGEGYFRIWHRGRFIEDQIDFNYRAPSADDWGSFEIMPTSVWWVKGKTPSGVEGWTNEPGNFSNQDACG